MWTWARHWRVALSLAIGSIWILAAFLLIGPLESRIANVWIIASALFCLFLVYGLLAPDHRAAPLFLAVLVVAGAAANARYGVDVCADSRTCEALSQGATGLLLLGALLLVLPTLLGSLLHIRLRRHLPADNEPGRPPRAGA